MTEEIRYIANLQRQEDFDNKVTELEDELKSLEQENKELIEDNLNLSKENKETIHYLACMTGYRNKFKIALEEIREMVLFCEEEYCCDRCKYHDNCLVDDDKFPDFSKALVNKINEVLNG